jgi:transcription elongation factor GreA
MDQEQVLTAQGRKSLDERLVYLETTRRREVSDQMKRAVDHGDLSENAEYDEARNAYLQLEKEINEVAGLIARARVIAEHEISTETVGIGSIVEIEDVDNGGDAQKYRVVSPHETDPENGKISHLCPIGTSLMNSRLGDVVAVKAPGGTRKYKVIAIAK